MKHPILNMKSSEFPASIVDTTRPRKSPAYLYCAANPVMHTDPTGLSTRVIDNGNGTYKVIGGALDGDLRIFLCENEQSESGIPIGVTPVETSFYDSDVEGGKWMEGAIIDPDDNSGIDFLNSIVYDTPSNIHYAPNAYGGKLYDFKVTNGTETKEDDNRNHYRGMPIQERRVPLLPVYSSARDIGNIVAGYVTGYNGLCWSLARIGFNILQSCQERKISTEGISSQNAQRFGHNLGLSNIRKELRRQGSGVFSYNFLFNQ